MASTTVLSRGVGCETVLVTRNILGQEEMDTTTKPMWPCPSENLANLVDWMAQRYFEVTVQSWIPCVKEGEEEELILSFGLCVPDDPDIGIVWSSDGSLNVCGENMQIPGTFEVGDTVGIGVARDEVYLVLNGDFFGNLKLQKAVTSHGHDHSFNIPPSSPEHYAEIMAHKSPEPIPSLDFGPGKKLHHFLTVSGGTAEVVTRFAPPFTANMEKLRSELFPLATESQAMYKRGYTMRHPPTCKRALDCMLRWAEFNFGVTLAEKRTQSLSGFESNTRWATELPAKWAEDKENIIRVILPFDQAGFNSGEGEAISIAVTPHTRSLCSPSAQGGILAGRLEGQPTCTPNWLHLRIGDPVLFTARPNSRPVALLDQSQAATQGPTPPCEGHS
ncbi:hypothetical protein Pelo_11865 [Pelomyxa schiedti]|nr:hypothetical protein Pelo_11865 [Pelomyxa schiedti]